MATPSGLRLGTTQSNTCRGEGSAMRSRATAIPAGSLPWTHPTTSIDGLPETPVFMTLISRPRTEDPSNHIHDVRFTRRRDRGSALHVAVERPPRDGRGEVVVEERDRKTGRHHDRSDCCGDPRPRASTHGSTLLKVATPTSRVGTPSRRFLLPQSRAPARACRGDPRGGLRRNRQRLPPAGPAGLDQDRRETQGGARSLTPGLLLPH